MSRPKKKDRFIPTQFSESAYYGYRSEEQLRKAGHWDIMPEWAKEKVRARDTDEWVKSFGKKRKPRLWKIEKDTYIPF